MIDWQMAWVFITNSLPELRRVQGQLTPPEHSDALTNAADRKLGEGQRVGTPARGVVSSHITSVPFCIKH